MDNGESKKILNVLSELMDESSDQTKTPVLDLYNDIRKLISGDLMAAVEKIAYRKKYDVINSANVLADAIGLYLNYPELISKYAVGFYRPDANAMRAITEHYLCVSDDHPNSALQTLSDTIPTVISYGSENDGIGALNLAGKYVALSPGSYALLNSGSTQNVDLTGLLACYCLHTRTVQKNQAVIVIPQKANRQQAFHKVLFNALDTLVIQDATPDAYTSSLLRGGNIKCIIAMVSVKNHSGTLSALARELGSKLIYEESVTNVFVTGKNLNMNTATYNFCNRTWMESCLCGVLWYLADQKNVLNERLAQINQDLVDNTEASKQIKELQKRVGDRIKQIDQTAETYYTAMTGILERIEKLQQLFGTEEKVNCHAVMADRLLELLATEGAFFKCFRRSNSNDHIRALYALCGQADANQNIAQLLVNDYFSNPQQPEDLEAFSGYKTNSSILLKKKLSMRKALKLTLEDCEEIIQHTDLPLSPLEYRLLGIAQYNGGKFTDAANNLKCALIGGDMQAGEFLYDHFGDMQRSFLANNGVPQAAYEMGKNALIKASKGDCNAMGIGMKYLHIAAAQNHLKAMERLGDIWYEKAMSAKSGRKKALKTALKYYLASQERKKSTNQMLERIGQIYHEQEDYPNAKRYLKKAETPQANFLLGEMYEKGLGLAADQQKALKYYETASDEGHAQAQVEYSRLSAKIEKEKEKTYISNNTSYYSSSYYSGYYTSYYSGW